MGFKRAELGMNIGQAQSQNRQMFNPFAMATSQQGLLQSLLTNKGLLADLKKSGGKGTDWRSWLTNPGNTDAFVSADQTV